MFKRNTAKINQLIMEVGKMRKNLLWVLAAMVFVFYATSAWAWTAPAPTTVTVSASVPSQTGMSVAISKVPVDANGTEGTWITGQTAIAFGTLTWNPTNHIFLPDGYFAVDIGVNDNSGYSWTINHSHVSLAGNGSNLDSKVNVSFNAQTDGTHGTQLDYVSFANSNKSYPKSKFVSGSTSGWLRIYYGIATGSLTKPDATGVTPVGTDTPSGTYNGSVTITLS